MLETWRKTDEDVVDKDIDAALWLQDGDALADTSTATIDSTNKDPSTLAIVFVQVGPDRMKVRIAGGADGEAAIIKVLVKTTAGLVKELNFRLQVRQR